MSLRFQPDVASCATVSECRLLVHHLCPLIPYVTTLQQLCFHAPVHPRQPPSRRARTVALSDAQAGLSKLRRHRHHTLIAMCALAAPLLHGPPITPVLSPHITMIVRYTCGAICAREALVCDTLYDTCPCLLEPQAISTTRAMDMIPSNSALSFTRPNLPTLPIHPHHRAQRKSAFHSQRLHQAVHRLRATYSICRAPSPSASPAW